MQLKCRSCGQPIPAQDINLQNMVAKCGQCNAVFGLSPQQLYGVDLPQQQSPGIANFGGRPMLGGGAMSPGGMPLPIGSQAAGFGGFVPVERGQVPMPPGIHVEMDGKDLVIRRSWWTWTAVFLLFFSIFWNGFIIVFISVTLGIGVFAGNAGAPFPFSFLPLLFLFIPALFGVIGLCMAYFTLCLFFNTTTIRADALELSVAHGPLPWTGNYVYPKSDVVQLYCIERVHHGKRGRISFTYEVEILTRNNDRRQLVAMLEDIGQALFIEQQLERHLGIQDAPVAGEVRRW